MGVERVVSGTGLVNVYEYLTSIRPRDVDKKIQAELDAAGDLKGAVIAKHKENALCRETMRIFATAYGAEAGNICLKLLPRGGLFLTGGLTPKNLDLIAEENGPFMQAMLDKGRVSGMLDGVPVYAVLAEDLGERGAHRVAFSDYMHLSAALGVHDTKTISSVSTKSTTLDVSSMLTAGALIAMGVSLGY